MSADDGDRVGATPVRGGGCRFVVWAPKHDRVEVSLLGEERVEPLERDELGYHRALIARVPPASRYVYCLSGERQRPDPAARLQPEGVHRASQVVDLDFAWTDTGWSGRPLSSYTIYELHVGTFTSEGTFDAVIGHLDRLRDLGVTAIEVMPVAQFPGTRNWGYDGVYPFAVQASYGGPRGLQRLVNACHERGLAVILDVVYNHVGPEGNYLGEFGPYFTDVYRTPWGPAINFDGPDSDGVRHYFLENASQWIRDFHIDALRLDAVHAILDRSARPFLEQLAEEIHGLGKRLGRHVALIAESDSNDPKLIRDPAVGGFGLDSMWCDDFHHAAHALLTGEHSGYYADFGRVEHLGRAWKRGMTYTGDYSSYRRHRHGRPIEGLQPHQVVVCVQNHDQVGNRLLGDRLTATVDFETEKLSAGLVVLSPYLPLLFMGQEYGETAPFQYFVSHSEPALVEAVRCGRREEFQSFGWKGEIPDPQSEDTFRCSVLDHDLANHDGHATLLELYKQLFVVRRRFPAVGTDDTLVSETHRTLLVRRDTRAWMVFNFGDRPSTLSLPIPKGAWMRAIASADPRWQGPGPHLPDTLHSTGDLRMTVASRSFCVYTSATQLSGHR